jgi:hypothetical protein
MKSLDLNLDWNLLTDYGASDLAEAIKANNKLVNLNLKIKSTSQFLNFIQFYKKASI